MGFSAMGRSGHNKVAILLLQVLFKSQQAQAASPKSTERLQQ